MSETFKFDWQRRILHSELPARLKFTGLVLSVYASGDGGSIYPGITRLASDLSQSESTVKRNLAALKKSGWVHQVQRGGRAKGGRSWASLYRLRFPSGNEDPLNAEGTRGAASSPHALGRVQQQLTSEHPPVRTPSTNNKLQGEGPSSAPVSVIPTERSRPKYAQEQTDEEVTQSEPDDVPTEETLTIAKVTKLANGMWEAIYSNGMGQKLNYKPTEPTPWARDMFERSKDM